MIRTLVAAAALAVCGPVFSDDSRLDVKEDRFTGKKTISYTSEGLAKGVPIVTMVGGDAPPALLLTFTSDDWEYLNCHDVHWLADGERLSLGDAVHDGSVFEGGVFEFLMLRPTSQQWAKLAAAQLIEYKVCGDEYAFSTESVSAVREFVEAINTHERKGE